MTKKTTKKQEPTGEPQWVEAWVPRDSIIKDATFQIRPGGVVPAAVKRYRDAAEAGAVFPLIKVARLPRGGLFLVDGWHRMAAGALTLGDDLGPQMVKVLLADMSEQQARWEAAQANLAHGEPLKPAARREVFRAFIEARQHRKPGGKFMSYREMTAVLGTKHTTIRNWMLGDFPKLAMQMGGSEAGGKRGGLHDGPSVAARQRAQALDSLKSVQAGLPAMEPEGRFEVLVLARELVAHLEGLPADEVVESEF